MNCSGDTLKNANIEDLLSRINARLDEIDEEDRKRNIDEDIDKLNNLIGLNDVKVSINKLVNYLKFLKRVENQTSLSNVNLNMIFKGNPGTGKTTVARIVADILYGLGFAENSKFAELTPRDFIAGYIGQTGVTTKKIINDYKGGIIFIDEAYGFVPEDGHENFSSEALTEIIKEMENRETIFIFAGYDKGMDDFINLNPGIKSRVGYKIDFPDYSFDELFEIFMGKIKSSNLNITSEAACDIRQIISIKMNEKNFGNGRMIDNLYEKLIIEHASINYDTSLEDKLLNIDNESTSYLLELVLQKRGGAYFE